MFQVCHYEHVKLQRTPTANLNIRRVISWAFLLTEFDLKH